jgi:hypothetical protein
MGEKKYVGLELLAKAVARFLDTEGKGEWTVTVATPDDSVRLHGPKGQGLHLFCSAYDSRARIEVSGEYPRDHHGRYVLDSVKLYSEAPPKITVAANRKGSAIGGEIVRRLLPSYEPLFEKCVAEIARRKAYEEHREALLTAATEYLGSRPWGQVTDYTRHTEEGISPGVQFRVEAGSEAEVRLTITGITTPDEVQTVLRTLKGVALALRPRPAAE